MSAKAIRVAPIPASASRDFIARWHYSGKPYCKSALHLGAFMGRRLVGVAAFGDPLDRAKVLPLVRDTPWHGMLELNRFAMVDGTPRNAESRTLSVCARIIRKQYPGVEWILSYADACQCGDGTIYRAAGFLLTGIKRNAGLYRYAGEIFTTVGINTSSAMRARLSRAVGAPVTNAREMVQHGAERLPGYMLRYILPLKDDVRGRLTVPVLPYSAIEDARAGMYRGRARSIHGDAPPIQGGDGGSNPTRALHSEPSGVA